CLNRGKRQRDVWIRGDPVPIGVCPVKISTRQSTTCAAEYSGNPGDAGVVKKPPQRLGIRRNRLVPPPGADSPLGDDWNDGPAAPGIGQSFRDEIQKYLTPFPPGVPAFAA